MDLFKFMEDNHIQKLEVKPNYTVEETLWIAQEMQKFGHELVVLITHPEVSLRAIIAVHDRTVSQQTLGGCRMLPYSNEKGAIADALRLSRAMTYKAVIAQVPFGGGKAVIWGDPHKIKTKALLETFGEEIENLGGIYITAEDMNLDENDLLTIRDKTTFVCGLSSKFRDGNYVGSGNPAPFTAEGTKWGMEAALTHLGLIENRSASFSRKTVAIQGLGAVGHPLAQKLLGGSVKQLIIADTDVTKIAKLMHELQKDTAVDFLNRIRIVPHDEIFAQECDIFAPCAVGGVLNDKTIPRLKCKIVAGAANNQLSEPRHGQMLLDRGILYAPDYVINAGGLINVAEERDPRGYDHGRASQRVQTIYNTLLEIFERSRRESLPPELVTDRMVEEELARLRKAS